MNNNLELRPLLKYPGGKTAELPIISEYAPETIQKYIEPFLGGGAVYFAIQANEYYVNDKSEDLMCLYQYIKDSNADFFKELETIIIHPFFSRCFLFPLKNLGITDLELFVLIKLIQRPVSNLQPENLFTVTAIPIL